MTSSLRLRIVVSALTIAGVATCSAQTFIDPAYQHNILADTLHNPTGIAVDGSQRVYVAESGAGQVLRSNGGGFSPLISGITVGTYVGWNVGPLSVAIDGDDLIMGEGGRRTGVEQVHHYDLDGNLVRSLPPIADGGNWYGSAVRPGSRDLFTVSANGDFIFRASRNGSTWGDLSAFSDLSAYGIVSPTGIVATADRIYLSAFGSFGSTSGVFTFDYDGNLIGELATGFFGSTGIALLPDGNLVLSEFGDFLGAPGSGNVYRLNALTGDRTLLMGGLGYATSVAVGSDGAIYATEVQTRNVATGRVHRLQAVPEPGTLMAVGLGAVALFRRRQRLKSA